MAYCTNRVNGNTASFQVLVQSGTRNATDILQNIDSFLSAYSSELSDYLSSDTSFSNLISVFNTVVTIKPLALSDATDSYWAQIHSGLQQFDFAEQLVNATSSLTASELLEFYNSNILNLSSAKKLTVAVYGNDKASTLETAFQHSIDYTNLDPRRTQYP